MLDIHERDIESRLCKTCGACCRITLKLRGTTSRYRRFLRQIGYRLFPLPSSGAADCCGKKHDATADMGNCKHLEVSGEGDDQTYLCRIYASSTYPDLCRAYNCVSWAKANDNYSERNQLLVTAQKALDRLRRAARARGDLTT